MIIGLNGVAGAGKDTVAAYLAEEYGFKRYAFADAVREVALAINPILASNWETTGDRPKLHEVRLAEVVGNKGWDWAKRNVPEVRRLLQAIGTEAGRMLLGPNVWVDIIDRKLRADGYPKAVITDLRFPNEDEYIRSKGGIIVKVIRPCNPDAIDSTYASEQYSPACDYKLDNSGTLERLHQNVDVLMHKLIKAPR